MLVDADTGGVDHYNFTFKGGGKLSEQSIPHPGLAPADELNRAGFVGGPNS